MAAPDWLRELLAWKSSANQKVIDVCDEPWAPNISDVDNKTSLRIAKSVLDDLGVSRKVSANSSDAKEESRGTALENAVTVQLVSELPSLEPNRSWAVGRGKDVRNFEQYQHLDELRMLLAETPSLRVALGTDYQIAPDVTVALDVPGHPLHAVVSCKWTLRSDRAQNVRHEFNLLVRSRRGRTPHLVAVTTEPLPSRLASLTRGTGEIDAVYHLAFEETQAAVHAWGTVQHKKSEPTQLELWREMTEQNRLKDYNDLAGDLARL
ncbi:NgoMIV family type II restriction endonuclease [Streptomyces rhizosphaericus]|uniref:Restriction endonuclease n=1 Tax=Streptomyces rhizosphaericus TaxID=114699 RepID=A0A6G4AN96_9ACTN|nr:NgoMIV family type II restriction endonuclease [Streptomyces rhizosphaericus]NEW74722.1 restriction endonuclease [Streptomyces rhizosphaericus]